MQSYKNVKNTCKNNDIKNKFKIVTKQLNKQKISIILSVNLLRKNYV